ncbi:hypothetical protein [Aurantiacibacter gangjinensis]|nr:hypothetical protein [Aurantiacibacter gangjinensis]
MEQQAIERLSRQNSTEDIRRVMENARDRSPPVFKAAFRRLVEVSAQGSDDPIAKACWEMVHTVEGVRKELGRPVWRMNRLRPKIEKDGEVAALEYCARNRTEGFDEVLEHELAEFTAEAIILRFPETFTDKNLREIARTRLVEAGVNVEAAVKG